jgi:hypothetical protein
VSTPRLSAIDIAMSDQPAMRGQLVTTARPGTKKVKATASSRRAGPVNPATVTTSSKAAMTPASRSRISARCPARADARAPRVDMG